MTIKKIALSPAVMLLFTVLFILISQLLALNLLSNQASFGLRLIADNEHNALRVESIAENSVAIGKVSVNESLTHIATAQDSVPLTPLVIIDAKQIKTDEMYKTYLDLQQRINNIVNSELPIHFVTTTKRQFTLIPEKHTPIATIPAMYWLIFVGNIIGIFVGLFVWIFKPYSIEGGFLFLAGLGNYSFATLSAIGIVKNLSFSAVFLHQLLFFELSCLYVFMMSINVILTQYPRKIGSWRQILLLLSIPIFFSSNFYFHWINIPLHFMLTPFIPLLINTLRLGYQQWKQAKNNPVDRVAILVASVAIITPSTLMSLFYYLPLILQQPPLFDASVAQLMPVILFVGWAIAILRYRLFAVEHWWFKSWVWLLGGCLVIITDLLLAWLLNTSQIHALGISLILAGFVYFPLRQWILAKLIPRKQQALQNLLPVFSYSMTSALSAKEFEQQWQHALKQHFSPLHIEVLQHTAHETCLSNNGLYLHAPNLKGDSHYQLSGKQKASRLFSKTDMQMVNSLLDIARMASNASEKRKQAVLKERKRIMHDLHDTVGARLLTLINKLPEQAHKKDAQDTLKILRDTIKLSLQKSPIIFAELQAEWRADIVERTEAVDTQLHWHVAPELMHCVYTPRQIIEINLFLSEAVSNALKHAQPKRLSINFSLNEALFFITISNDGTITPPESWKKGTGMDSLRERINALKGEFTIDYLAETKMIQLKATIPHPIN